jgi:Zn-dependent M32 family carboxypeptidase
MIEDTIREIKQAALEIPVQKIAFSQISSIKGRVSQTSQALQRNQDLAITFQKYAEEEQNPKLKARFERGFERYTKRAESEKQSISQSNEKIAARQEELNNTEKDISDLQVVQSPIQVLDSLGKLIAAMKNLNQNTEHLEELYNKLLEELEISFTVILEYAVSV